jgi:hypothetical protein
VANEGATLAALVTDLNEDLSWKDWPAKSSAAYKICGRRPVWKSLTGFRCCITATPKLAQAVEAYKEYITAETLTVKIGREHTAQNMLLSTDSFDGETLTVGLAKA